MTTVCLLLVACAQSGQQRSVIGRSTLVIAQQREPRSLNPSLENGQSQTEWGELLFSFLVKYDDHAQLVPDVATEVPSLANGGISADGLTVTYHLRKNVRFADGQPLTARDCVWSINAINNPANLVQSRYGYDKIASATAPNDTTLVLHLKEPFSPLLTLVMAPQGFPILPQHVLAKYPDFNRIDFNTKPVGSGPYVVDQWLHGDRVEMHANPYYFRGKPRIEHLTVRFVPDAQTAVNLLQTHEVQGYFNAQDYAQYPLLMGLSGYHVLSTPVSAVGAIIFNTRSPQTNDPNVRHALAQAIDVPSLVAKASRGALNSDNAGRGLFIWAYDKRAYPDIPYDPAHARALLDRAGWRVGANGVRSKNGVPLEVTMVIQAATPGDALIGNSVTQYERAVGARVELKQYNITQFVAPVSQGGPVYGGKFQLALYPFVNGDDPDTTDQFACANVPPKGYNKSRICDPRIDALLLAGRSTFDLTKRKAIYAQLQRLLYQELPIILIYQRREIDAFTSRLQGETGSTDSVFWNVGSWRLSGD
ncbi:MAG TPA: peptide ABC transporter substrate-binding protein [Candidatus Rubrimentiphilum sp.]|nr:peptide ABC transporter substrate-binding protein [Candidatus Rubrimentiphilum sp.]